MPPLTVSDTRATEKEIVFVFPVAVKLCFLSLEAKKPPRDLCEMCGCTLPEKKLAKERKTNRQNVLEETWHDKSGCFSPAVLSLYACQVVFSFLFFRLARVCVCGCVTPLATSGPELCDTRPAGAAAAELCPSRSEGNWVVFLQGIYSQRRKYSETHAPDGSINTRHRENFSPHTAVEH